MSSCAHGDLLATLDGEVLLRDLEGDAPALVLIPRDLGGDPLSHGRVVLTPSQARYLGLVLLRYADSLVGPSGQRWHGGG